MSNEYKTIEAVFEHVATTRGAQRYQEIDINGNKLQMSDAATKIGALYLRKQGTGMVTAAPYLKVTIEPLDSLDD